MKLLFGLILLLIISEQTLLAQDCYELQKIVASDRDSLNSFGQTLAISHSYAVVGAPFNDYDELGANYQSGAGAVYIYEKTSNGWIEVQKIVASDRTESDGFGWSVDIQEGILVVGASSADAINSVGSGPGAVYIYKKQTSNLWVQSQKIIMPGGQNTDSFGEAVRLNKDLLIIGNPEEDLNFSRSGAAYIYRLNSSGIYSFEQKIIPLDQGNDDRFAESIALSNETIVCGALGNGDNAGAAYIFNKNNNNTWVQTQKIISHDLSSDDLFGYSVGIDSNLIVVGAYFKYRQDSVNPNSFTRGAAYVFELNPGGVWEEVKELKHINPKNSNQFGFSVSIKKPYILITSLGSKSGCGMDTVNHSGDAYLFVRNDTNWLEIKNFVASDRVQYESFGCSSAMDEDYILIGNYRAKTDEQGLNLMFYAGATYFFEMPNYKVSVEKRQLESEYKIYPNPSNGKFTLVSINNNQLEEVTMFDLLGNIIYRRKITTKKEVFDFSYLENGTYFLRVKNIIYKVFKN